MKVALFTIWICLFAMPAFAQNNQGQNNQGQNNQGQNGQGNHRGAPAPLIGAGIPILMAAGGGLLGWKLLKRK
jgi:hypothetical protein